MINFGIDFGTSNTCISYILNGTPHIVINERGSYTTPSCLFFYENSDNILYGETALECKDKGTLITNIKRLFGLLYDDYIKDKNLEQFFKNINIERDPTSNYCSILITHNHRIKRFTINKLIEYYLKWLLTYASSSIENSSRDIVITVPVHFNLYQRESFKNCFTNIGYNVLRILNEPTAATLAYIQNNNTYNSSLEKTSLENILVLDCGGGTTDCTILEADYDNLFFEVLETWGDPFLGGSDLTNKLVSFIISNLLKNKCTFSIKQTEYIRKQSEICKHNLSFKDNYNFIIYQNDQIYTKNISRISFQNINTSWFKRLETIIKNISYKIDKIILVGGTTRIPFIQDILINHFGKDIPIYNKIDPDHTVSIGASVQANMLSEIKSENNITFLDTISMSLGIETIGSIMTPIISKNTIIPCNRTETFVATQDNININIYQGEKRFVTDNLFLGSVKINNIKKDIIQISFDINSDGILKIKVKNNSNGSLEIISINDYKKCIDTLYTYEDDFNKLSDIEISNLILAKIELNNSLELLQSVSLENNTSILTNTDYIKLLKDTKNVIENYKKYTSEYLKNYKQYFEEEWHKLHFT